MCTQSYSPPFPEHLGFGHTEDERAAIAIRKIMSFEQIQREIDDIFAKAQQRYDDGDRSTLPGNQVRRDCGTPFSLLDWMTSSELVRKHQLQLALPTNYEKMVAASVRISKRIAERRAKRSGA